MAVRLPVLHDDHLTGRQLEDSWKQRVRSQGRPERQSLIERDAREARRGTGDCQDCLDLGRKQKPAVTFGIEQRKNAGAVAGEYEATSTRIPNGKRELTIQLMYELVTVLLVGMNKHLGIGAGLEPVSLLLEVGP